MRMNADDRQAAPGSSAKGDTGSLRTASVSTDNDGCIHEFLPGAFERWEEAE